MAARSRVVRPEEAGLSDAQRMAAERSIKSFRIAARAALQNADAPDETWLASYLEGQRNKKGVGFARRFANHIALHLRRSGAPVSTDGDLVQAILREPDLNDPLSIELSSDGRQNRIGAAQRYADNAYHPETYRSYAAHGAAWLKWCSGSGIDPLHPTVTDLCTYLELLGERLQSGSVRNRRSAIGHYLRKNGVTDNTREREVNRVLRGLTRKKVAKPIYPLTAQERRTLLSSLERYGMGVRDRVILLLLSFTELPYERFTFIDVEHVTVVEDGVSIASLNDDPPFFVGAHPENDLDLTYWMQQLLGLLPRTGPLLRPAHFREFRFSDERLTYGGLGTAVRRIANRLGIGGEDLPQRLRLLFAAETHDKVSDIVRTRYANKRNLPLHVQRASQTRFSAPGRKRRRPEGSSVD